MNAVVAPVWRLWRSERRRRPEQARWSLLPPAAGIVIGKAGLFDQSVRDIHSEAVDAAVEPESQDAAELSRTQGLSQLRSGWEESNRCRYHCPSVPSGRTTRVQAPPPKTDCQLFGGRSPPGPLPSRKMYRARSSAALP